MGTMESAREAGVAAFETAMRRAGGWAVLRRSNRHREILDSLVREAISASLACASPTSADPTTPEAQAGSEAAYWTVVMGNGMAMGACASRAEADAVNAELSLTGTITPLYTSPPDATYWKGAYERMAAERDAARRAVSGCPFDYPDVDIDETTPCPVCGGLGTFDAENKCPFPPGVNTRHVGDINTRNAIARAEAAEARNVELEAALERVNLHCSAWEDSARINKHRADEAENELTQHRHYNFDWRERAKAAEAALATRHDPQAGQPEKD